MLRFVLLNFIVNAADTVRESRKSQRSLHIGAQILREADGEQLYLYCTDNGVGIAPDNLGRVFEKGFSTKSKETHDGIGLYCCANSIGALGGRIWATNEGTGRGASMHLMAPLGANASVQIARVA